MKLEAKEVDKNLNQLGLNEKHLNQPGLNETLILMRNKRNKTNK